MDPTQNNVFGNQPPMDTGGFGAPVSSGVPMNSGVPMSSGTGDIVLNNGGGKSKKWWIVGVIALVAIIIIVAVVGSRFVGSPVVQNNNCKNAMDLYINYYLYGITDGRGVDLGKVSEDGFVSFVESGLSDDDVDNNTLLAEASNYYNDAYGVCKGRVSDIPYYTNLLNDYKEELDLVKTFFDNGGLLSEAELLEEYNAKGESGAKDFILEKARPYESFRDYLGFNVYSLIDGWNEDGLKMLVYLDKDGCLVDGKIDYECAMNNKSEENDSISKDATEKYSTIERVIGIARENLMRRIDELIEITNVVEEGNYNEE